MSITPSLETRRVYSWCVETRMFGEVDAAQVAAAVAACRSAAGGGVPRAWLIDASEAAGLSSGSLDAIRAALADLAAGGLSAVGIALPAFARVYAPMVGTLAPHGVLARAFPSQGSLRFWASKSCPA